MSLLAGFGGVEHSDLLDFLLDDVFPVAEHYGKDWGLGEAEALCDPAVEDFLSELLSSPLCDDPASPPASDSGISEGQAALPSPGDWEFSPPHSPSIVQSEHNYSIPLGEDPLQSVRNFSMPQEEEREDPLQSVRSLTCLGDVFIDLGKSGPRSHREDPPTERSCDLTGKSRSGNYRLIPHSHLLR
ncbi:uncharacterized protein ACMZJ9_021515, partial [Mantella aurantiaca]